MVYRFLSNRDKFVCNANKGTGIISGIASESKELFSKFEKREVHSSFIGNIWSTDFADIQLLSKFNKGICFLLYVIGILKSIIGLIKLCNAICLNYIKTDK